jgi:hypothetical protein
VPFDHQLQRVCNSYFWSKLHCFMTFCYMIWLYIFKKILSISLLSVLNNWICHFTSVACVILPRNWPMFDTLRHDCRSIVLLLTGR